MRLFAALRRRRASWRLRKSLAANSDARLDDLVIPDGLDGHIHLAHVLRTAAGFIVVDVVRLDGALFGAPSIDEWTVMGDGRSHKFRNPVAANHARVQAVRALLPRVPVHGLVVLLGAVSFPKGHPEGTATLHDLPAALAALPRAPGGPDWDEAWYGLAACTSASA